MSQETTSTGSKRKADAISNDQGEIEVDLNAPEPPSKKSLRKAKKAESKKKSDPEGSGSDNERSTHEQIADSKQDTESKDRGSKKSVADYGIWIGNLAFFTTRDELLTFFTKPGTGITEKDITRINLPKGPPRNSKPQNKGFAYVDVNSKEAQNAAVALSEQLLGGRRVLIKGSKNFEGRPDKPVADATPSMPSSKRIFVGNLSFDVTVDDLKQHFSRCGDIEHVHMATFQDSGKCKGYAWITFEQLSSAEAAVKGWFDVLEDKDEEEPEGKQTKKRVYVNKIFGRKLRMEFAEDPTTRYNKRFGKNAAEGQDTAEGDGITEVSEDTTAADSRNPSSTKKTVKDNSTNAGTTSEAKRKQKRQDDNSSRKDDNSRYGQATVQRLTGAAVEGQGKKITFD